MASRFVQVAHLAAPPRVLFPHRAKTASQQAMDMDYRESSIHPAERCVLCHLQNGLHSHATDAKSRGKHQDKKGSNVKWSACASACGQHSGRWPIPNCGQLDDAETCVLASAFCPNSSSAAKQFPFYHAAARQTKVWHSCCPAKSAASSPRAML